MNFLNGMSLKNKIILLSITLVIFISGVFSSFYIQYLTKQTENSTYNNSKALSCQISRYFDDRVLSIITSVYTFANSDAYNSDLYDYFNSNDEYAYALTITKINNLISDAKINNSLINSIYICTPKGNFYDLSSRSDAKYDFLSSGLFKEYTAADSPYIYEGHSETEDMFTEKKTVIPFISKTMIPGYSGEVYLVININCHLLENYLSQCAAKQEDIIVVNSKRQLVVSNNKKLDDYYLKMISTHRETQWNLPDYIVSYNKLKTDDWTVITFYNKNDLKNTIRYSQYFVIFTIIVSSLIAVIISIYFSKRIVSPLEKLQDYMVRVTKGEYALRYEYPYKNEVGRLTECFNYMVEKVGTLISTLNSAIEQLKMEKENVKQEQSLKRIAELNALQAQINPHFLYNTLNSIVWLAAENKTDEISRIASELSKFYEYRINRGKSVIPIRDEIEQIKSYLTIQKIRYKSKLEYQFFLDEPLLDKLIIKMVVQPLVENSISHGIQCKDGAKNIIIRVFTKPDLNDDIVIEVEDDGIGIPSDVLSEMNMRLLSCKNVPENGYGIYNVNERIKLYFGNEYGLQFESEYHKWTKARIIIPQTNNLLE